MSRADATLERFSPEFRERYAIEEVLGQGGTGLVLRATDKQVGRTVVIKVLLADTSNEAALAHRFHREARILAILNHPQLVKVYDLKTDNGMPYIVFEWSEGEALNEVIGRDAPMASVRVAAMGLEIFSGLKALHGVGVVHRDLKPANILATPRGLKIIDLGYASVAEAVTRLTGTQCVVGTVAYMAPEQLTSAQVSPSADLYAAGCVMYACLAGQHPFSVGVGELLARKITGQMPRLDTDHGVPASMANFVHRLLEAAPEDRPASAGAARDELESLLKALTQPAPRAPTPKAVPSADGDLAGADHGAEFPRLSLALGFALAALTGGLAESLIGTPRFGEPRVEPVLGGVEVSFRQDPAGRARVLIDVDGAPPQVLDAGSSSEHRLFVPGPGPGSHVRARPFRGRTEGPSATLVIPQRLVSRATARRAGDGLQVQFQTTVPALASLRPAAAAGAAWSTESGAPRLEHSISMSPRGQIPLPDLALKLVAGSQTEELNVDMDPGSRQLFLDDCIEPFARIVQGAVQPMLDGLGRQVGAKQRVGTRPTGTSQVLGLLPAVPVLRALGGEGGVLASGLSPERKSDFWRALRLLEMLDLVMLWHRDPHRYPFHMLYAPTSGPSLEERWPDAAEIPVAMGAVDTPAGINLLAVPWSGPVPVNSTLALEGVVDPGHIKEGMHTELAIRARFARRRLLVATIGTMEVTVMGLESGGHDGDFFVAFDSRALKPGRNRIRIVCPRLPGPLEETDPDHGAHLSSPGVRLRVSP